MQARHANEGAVQRFHARLAMPPRLSHQLLDGPAHFNRRGCVRHGLSEADRDGIGNAARPFPAEAAFLKAENAAPNTIERDRDNGRVDVLHNALESTAKRKHLADARDLALGKDANDFAVFNRLAGFAQRLNHLAWPQLGGDRNHSHGAGERLDPGLLVEGLVHHETDFPASRGEQQEGIDLRKMIADQQRATCFGNMFAALDANAVKSVREKPEQGAQRPARKRQLFARHGFYRDTCFRPRHELTRSDANFLFL